MCGTNISIFQKSQHYSTSESDRFYNSENLFTLFSRHFGLKKRNVFSFTCKYFKLCNLLFITISNHPVWAFSLTEPGNILSNAHLNESYRLLSSAILFDEMSNTSPVLSIIYNVGFLPGNNLTPPSNSRRFRMSLRKPDGSICSDTVKSFCLQHLTEIRAPLFSNESKDCVVPFFHKNGIWGGN